MITFNEWFLDRYWLSNTKNWMVEKIKIINQVIMEKSLEI